MAPPRQNKRRFDGPPVRAAVQEPVIIEPAVVRPAAEQ